LILAIFNATTRRIERRVATVVGIVSDIKSSSLVDGLAEPYVYLPLAQAQNTGMLNEMSIVTRRRGNTTLESQIGAILRELDPALVLSRTESLSEAMALGLAPQRVLAAVAAGMGLVSLLLAAMGIYGVTAYSVALRRREFGIRLALGAPRVRVISMVIRQGMWLVAAGAVIGLALAIGAGRVLAVKGVAEAEHVACQPDADPVRRVPGRDGRHPGHGHVDELGGDSHDQEQQRQAGQLTRRRAVRGLVDDGPNDQRPGQDQRRSRGHERAKTGPTPGVGPEQGAEGAPSGGCRGHRNDSSLPGPLDAADFPNRATWR